MNISLLVAVKNNLEYTKQFYETTRLIYPTVEICFCSYGSTDGTHDWLNEIQQKDEYTRAYINNENKTFSDTYNGALRLATKDYVAYLHNDIIITPNFCENILKHANESTIVSYTTIEPPIFAGHQRPGKRIKDFGASIGETDIAALNKYSFELQEQYKDVIDDGVTFFMCMPRKVLLEMGGLDPLFNPCFCEDDDLILRFLLRGMKLITSADAVCYHYVSKTSRFSDEYKDKTTKIEMHSNRNFLRKWGFKQSHYKKRYYIKYVIKNCNAFVLENLEPFCDEVFVDCPIVNYIIDEQQHTSFNMIDRVHNIHSNKFTENDVVVEIDGDTITQDAVNVLHNLHDILFETNTTGKFQVSNLVINIHSLNDRSQTLINKGF